MQQRVFLISGLGADRRLFNKFSLPGYDPVFVDWIEPDVADTLTTYAQKLINHYGIQPQSVVIGVSMGGMLTVEISQLLALKKAIIISSIKSAAEFPFYFAFFRRLPVYKIIPHRFYSSLGFLIKPLFGGARGKSGFLFADMIGNASPTFMVWAMHAILWWQPSPLTSKIYHIIGNKDLIFQHRRIKDATCTVDGGTHAMIHTRGAEISKLVQDILINETA